MDFALSTKQVILAKRDQDIANIKATYNQRIKELKLMEQLVLNEIMIKYDSFLERANVMIANHSPTNNIKSMHKVGIANIGHNQHKSTMELDKYDENDEVNLVNNINENLNDTIHSNVIKMEIDPNDININEYSLPPPPIVTEKVW